MATQDTLDQVNSQRAQLTASLSALRAARESAQIALDQTVIRAPFDGTVLDQQATLGAVVSPGQAIAQLYTDARIEVTVPIDETAAGLIPGLFTGDRAAARVEARFAGRTVTWDAAVTRVSPALDSRTRTLSVTVALTDPREGRLATGEALASGTPPALINAFVDVTLEGAQMADLYAIPSTALRARQALWLVGADDTLTIISARPVHIDGETTYVAVEGDLSGARLITSTLDTPIPGMALRIAPSAVAAVSE